MPKVELLDKNSGAFLTPLWKWVSGQSFQSHTVSRDRLRLTSTLMIMALSTDTAFRRSFLVPSLDSYRRTYSSLLLLHLGGRSSDFLSLESGWEDTRGEKTKILASIHRTIKDHITHNLIPSLTSQICVQGTQQVRGRGASALTQLSGCLDNTAQEELSTIHTLGLGI